MAAVATKKPDGDRGVQLTFPLNFQKAFDAGFNYFPSDLGEPLDLFVGQDFQSRYHEQKRLDANQSVRNGLQANATAERLMLTGPHNYHVPKAVLSQRRYANPSYGAEALVSTRRDNGVDAPFHVIEGTDIMMGAGPMTGGVLKTAQGYDFYRGQLDARVEQLNRINAVAQGFAVPMGQSVNTRNNETEGGPNKVDFFLLLRAFMDAVESSDFGRFTVDNAREFVGKLLNFGPYASQEDFEDMIKALAEPTGLIQVLRDAESNMDEGRALIAIETLRIIAEKSYEYLRVMFANINRSENEKKSLSKSLVKTLRFDKFMGQRSLGAVINALSKTDSSLAMTIEDFDDGSDDGMFEGPSMGREDSEQPGVPRAPFAGEGLDENRDKWGRRGRPQREGEMPGYFGEEVAADMPGVVAPLAVSGFDPGSQAPPPDAGSMMDALEATMQNEIRGVATTDEDLEKMRSGEFRELVERLYPAGPEQFVNSVASAMEERGYTKAQVAAAMGQTSLPFFADYIASNSGDVGPAPAAPARRYPPAGPQPQAPLYGPPPPSGPPSVASRTSTTATGAPPAGAVPAWMSAYPTRKVLRQKLNTVEKVRAFMDSVPAEAGLKAYTPRLSSNDNMKSVHETLIRNIAQVVPGY